MTCVSNSPIFKEIKTKDILQILKNYLYSDNDSIIAQATLCLGNIVAEGIGFRDHALKLNILEKVVNLSKDVNRSNTLIKNCLFLITNLTRGKPAPNFIKVILF